MNEGDAKRGGQPVEAAAAAATELLEALAKKLPTVGDLLQIIRAAGLLGAAASAVAGGAEEASEEQVEISNLTL